MPITPDQFETFETLIRAKVLQHYISRFPDGLTADEVAIDLDLSVLTVRPRVSELHRDARIEDTGLRRRNQSGMTATVWRYVREPGPMEKS